MESFMIVWRFWMRRVLTPLFFCVLALVSCAPATERVQEFDSSVIQSLSTFRERDLVTLNWGISGELTTYTTWIEFYQENPTSFLAGSQEQAYEGEAFPDDMTFFYETFLLREVANYSREGTRETHALMFYIALQLPGGRTIRSELNQVTFFTVTPEGDEK